MGNESHYCMLYYLKVIWVCQYLKIKSPYKSKRYADKSYVTKICCGVTNYYWMKQFMYVWRSIYTLICLEDVCMLYSETNNKVFTSLKNTAAVKVIKCNEDW